MGTWSLRDTQYDFKMVFFMVLQGLYYNPQGSHEPDILAIKGSLNIGISCASTQTLRVRVHCCGLGLRS